MKKLNKVVFGMLILLVLLVGCSSSYWDTICILEPNSLECARKEAGDTFNRCEEYVIYAESGDIVLNRTELFEYCWMISSLSNECRYNLTDYDRFGCNKWSR